MTKSRSDMKLLNKVGRIKISKAIHMLEVKHSIEKMRKPSKKIKTNKPKLAYK